GRSSAGSRTLPYRWSTARRSTRGRSGTPARWRRWAARCSESASSMRHEICSAPRKTNGCPKGAAVRFSGAGAAPLLGLVDLHDVGEELQRLGLGALEGVAAHDGAEPAAVLDSLDL